MVCELQDTARASALFRGWQETMIYSCLQGVMGKIYVTDQENPKSASAVLGCFVFYAGEPERELIFTMPKGFVILIPQNPDWAEMIEECCPSVKKTVRYAMKKDTRFDTEMLQREAEKLPNGYEMKKIDAEIYDKCLLNPVTSDFVAAFDSKCHYLSEGRGIVVVKDGEIVAGASSYSRYKGGIEIEVDTVERERKKHLATAACSALILMCLDEGLYPSWDAQNVASVHLAEKLGYEFDHEYVAYEAESK